MKKISLYTLLLLVGFVARDLVDIVLAQQVSATAGFGGADAPLSAEIKAIEEAVVADARPLFKDDKIAKGWNVLYRDTSTDLKFAVIYDGTTKGWTVTRNSRRLPSTLYTVTLASVRPTSEGKLVETEKKTKWYICGPESAGKKTCIEYPCEELDPSTSETPQ